MRRRSIPGETRVSLGVRHLNELLKDCLHTPKDDLLKKKFSHDHFGMTNILKAEDRRIGYQRLQKLFKDREEGFVVRVLFARQVLQHGLIQCKLSVTAMAI